MSHKKQNVEWTLHTNENGSTPYEDAILAVLMDIRVELQNLNRLLRCPNFTGMPKSLERINKRLLRMGGKL